MLKMVEALPGDKPTGLSTGEKALKINLDLIRYGTFAEIGVSDAIYGRCKRYVSRERLQSMLDYEHRLNLERLRSSRGDNTAFFAFADTVAVRNYEGTNECHGWMGVKYQAHPRDDDSRSLSMSACWTAKTACSRKRWASRRSQSALRCFFPASQTGTDGRIAAR